MRQRYKFHFVMDESYFDSIYHARIQGFRKWGRVPLLLLVWVLLIYLEPWIGSQHEPGTQSLFVITGAAVLFWTRRGAKAKAVKIDRIAKKDPGLGNKLTVVFDSEQIQISGTYGESCAGYEAVRMLAKTQEYYIVKINRFTTAVPIRLLEKEEIGPFEEFLKERVRVRIRNYSYIKPYVPAFLERTKTRRIKNRFWRRFPGLIGFYLIVVTVTFIVLLILWLL